MEPHSDIEDVAVWPAAPKRARIESSDSFTSEDTESSSGATSSTEASSSDRGRYNNRSTLPKVALEALRRYVVKRVDALRKQHAVHTKGSSFCWERDATKSERHLARTLLLQSNKGATSNNAPLLEELAVQRMILAARLSADVAVMCHTRSRSSSASKRVATVEALQAQRQLEGQLTALVKCRISRGLARHLGHVCWHTAWERVWKCSLGRLRPDGTAADDNEDGIKADGKASVMSPPPPLGMQEVEFQRRVDELRAELAFDAAQDWQGALDDQRGWRGANIGGWLLWEKGPCDSAPIVKAVLNGGADEELPMCEWELSRRLREKHGDEEALRLMKQHRATYVTRTTFERIAARGLNAVRIPVSYWLMTGPRDGEPFLGPDTDPLDNAFRWASELNLKIVLSMHGNVGSQSDHQACGRYREDWKASDWHPEATLEAVVAISKRYAGHPALGGIAVTNEPQHGIPLDILQKYYNDAYWAIRNAGVTEDVEVVMPVYHRDAKDFCGRFSEAEGFKNVTFDVHVYHVFGEDWQKMSLADHLRYASGEEGHDVTYIKECGGRVIIGEWCLALPIRDWAYTVAWEWGHLTTAERNAVRKSMAMRQLRTYAKHSDGWFFWSWRDEDSLEWCMEDCLERGYLPSFSCFEEPLKPARQMNARRSSQVLKMPGEAARWHRGEKPLKSLRGVGDKDKKQRHMKKLMTSAMRKTVEGVAAWKSKEAKRIKEGRRAPTC